MNLDFKKQSVFVNHLRRTVGDATSYQVNSPFGQKFLEQRKTVVVDILLLGKEVFFNIGNEEDCTIPSWIEK